MNVDAIIFGVFGVNCQNTSITLNKMKLENSIDNIDSCRSCESLYFFLFSSNDPIFYHWAPIYHRCEVMMVIWFVPPQTLESVWRLINGMEYEDGGLTILTSSVWFYWGAASKIYNSIKLITASLWQMEWCLWEIPWWRFMESET